MPWENDGYGENDYWVDAEDDDGYYDDYSDEPDYDHAPWPDPDPTLLGRLKRLVNRLRLRWYLWRHSDEFSDIPF